ncbi:MAG: GreA/GreB family elongation factor [Methyloprofundus sp.]|nr:GreA/GreB family elongation factor [Methyloprofundus sp.]
MSRWKPPRPKSSPYITPEGFKQLEQELRSLWDRRKGVVSALSDAAAEGDRSENAEYIYRKKELRGIDARIHFLQKRLAVLNIVADKPSDQERIFFAAWVQLLTDEETMVLYRIVGGDEFEQNKCYISVDSPLAQQLLKKTFDEVVRLKIGGKFLTYTVLDIQYGAKFIADE